MMSPRSRIRDMARAITATVALAAVVVTAGPHAPASASGHSAAVATAAAGSPSLHVLSHTFNVAIGEVAAFTVSLPAGYTADQLPTTTFQVTSYERATTPDDVAGAIAGDLPRAVDAAVIPSDTVELAADATSVTLRVAVEAGNESDATLQFSRPGVYPVVVEVIDGTLRGRAITFVHRVDSAGASDPINVALVGAVTTDVRLDANGAVVVPSSTADRLAELADTLASSAIPLGITVDPSAITDTAASNPSLADQLRTSADRHEFVSEPAPPLDPAAAAAADATDVFIEWLRSGEDQLAGALGVTARRSVHLASDRLSTGAATMLRDLGTRLVVLTPREYDQAEGSLTVFTDTSQLIGIALDDDGRLPAMVIDRTAGEALTDASINDHERATAATAVVLSHRQRVIDRLGEPGRHTVVLGAPDLTLPGTDLVEQLTTLLATTPGVEPILPDDIVDRTEALLFDGRPVAVTLDQPDVVDLAPRIESRDRSIAEATSTASMLVDEPDTLTGWVGRAGLLPSTALSDSDAVALSDALADEYVGIRDAVQLPAPSSFLITGSENTIPLRFTNTSSRPLLIRVRLSAPRLIVPGGDQLVELAPNAVTTLDIAVRTRSNGRSPASLDVFTPQGDIQIGERVDLTARVTSLAGVGNLVTGVAILMLLTWWFRHWRRNRRPEPTATLPSS